MKYKNTVFILFRKKCGFSFQITVQTTILGRNGLKTHDCGSCSTSRRS